MAASGADLPGEAPCLLRSRAGGVVTLTLNRPERYNVLSEEMLSALQRALDELARDDEARVVVLAARGRAFCAGHDLREMRAHGAPAGQPDKAYYEALFDRCSRVMLALTRLPQPVIARVQGLATAAGCQLVATCDLAVAAEEARFATSGIGVGLFCSTPAVALSRNVPRKIAAEMLFTGEFIDAATALSHGLVNRVVPAERLDETVGALAERIASMSRVAVTTGKEMLAQQLAMPLAEAYRYAGHTMACDMESEDAAEGIDAFLEKRPPRWKHR